MYVEGPPPLYISYASPEQTRYQETLEAAGDKGQRIKKVTKVNESKQCMEGGLQEEKLQGQTPHARQGLGGVIDPNMG